MTVIPAFTKQIYDWSDEYGPEGAFRIMLSYYPLVIVCKPEDAEVIKTSLYVEYSVSKNHQTNIYEEELDFGVRVIRPPPPHTHARTHARTHTH